jgi:hypothetical protein
MFHFRCDGCDLALELAYRPRVYLLEDGQEVPMAQQHVWCVRCGTVTPAASEIARCLRCGGEVELPGSDWADLFHGGCGGTLRCSATIVGGTFARCQPHRYAADGALIEIGRRFGMFEGEPDVPLELW